MKKKFEWHEKKNELNIDNHGIDFNDAVQAFDNPMITKIDDRNDYGETRWIAIGKMLTLIVVIVYTLRNGLIRLISVRKANKKEREIYHEQFEKNKQNTQKDPKDQNELGTSGNNE